MDSLSVTPCSDKTGYYGGSQHYLLFRRVAATDRYRAKEFSIHNIEAQGNT